MALSPEEYAAINAQAAQAVAAANAQASGVLPGETKPQGEGSTIFDPRKGSTSEALTSGQQTALTMAHGLTGKLGTEYLLPFASAGKSMITGDKPMTASDFDREYEIAKKRPGAGISEFGAGIMPFAFGAGPIRKGVEAVEKAAHLPAFLRATGSSALSSKLLPQMAWGSGIATIRDLMLNKVPEQISGAENRSAGEMAGEAGLQGVAEGTGGALAGKLLHRLIAPGEGKVSTMGEALSPGIRERAKEIIEQGEGKNVTLSGSQAAQEAAREAGQDVDKAAKLRQRVADEAEKGGHTPNIEEFAQRQGDAVSMAKTAADTEVQRLLNTAKAKKEAGREFHPQGADQDVNFRAASLLNDVKATLPPGTPPNSPAHYKAALDTLDLRIASARTPKERADAMAVADQLNESIKANAPKMGDAFKLQKERGTLDRAAQELWPKATEEAQKTSGNLLKQLAPYGGLSLPAVGYAMAGRPMAAAGSMALNAIPPAYKAARAGLDKLGREGAVNMDLNQGKDFLQNVGRIGTDTGAVSRALGPALGQLVPGSVGEKIMGLVGGVPLVGDMARNAVETVQYALQSESPYDRLKRREKGRRERQ